MHVQFVPRLSGSWIVLFLPSALGALVVARVGSLISRVVWTEDRRSKANVVMLRPEARRWAMRFVKNGAHNVVHAFGPFAVCVMLNVILRSKGF